MCNRDLFQKVRIKEQLKEKKDEAHHRLIDDDFEKVKELVDECIDLKQQLGEVEALIKAGLYRLRSGPCFPVFLVGRFEPSPSGRNRELKKKIDANKQRTDEEK